MTTADLNDRKIVLIGSSGGGGATEGHSDPASFVAMLEKQLGAAGLCLGAVQIVATADGTGLDHAGPGTPAILFKRLPGEARLSTYQGSLKDVNDRARSNDKILAEWIRKSKACAGMITVSSDVVDINARALEECIKQQVPMTGTGGSSVSRIMELGANFVGGGGSVSTTAMSRAVSYTHALSNALGRTYNPSTDFGQPKPSLLSILDSTVPAFIAVTVLRRLLVLTHQENPILDEVLQKYCLPTLCCIAVVQGRAGPAMGSLGLLTSAIAGLACSGSIIAGLIVGMVLAHALPGVLFGLIRANVPATACSIILTVACSFYGVLLGNLLSLVLIPVRDIGIAFLQDPFGRFHSNSMEISVYYYDTLFFAIVGMLMCRGSKTGYYHSVALPLILVEMEHGDFSTIGFFDVCTLVCVSCGICAAVWLRRGDALARKGFLINMCFGDMVEAAYPYMDEHYAINMAGYIGSALSGCFSRSYFSPISSSAYMPIPLSILMAGLQQKDEPLYINMILMGAACFAAWFVPFVITFAVLPAHNH